MSFDRKVKRNGLKAVQPAPAQKERVHVAVFCVEDYIHVSIAAFAQLMDRLSQDPAFPWEFAFSYLPGMRPVQYARNRAVKEFLAGDADRLLMIDHDMIPQKETVAILAVDADIVAPRMHALKRDDAGTPRLDMCAYRYNVLADRKFNALLAPVGAPPVPVDAVGTGCMAIRRKVLEDRRMWLPMEYEWHGVARSLDDEEERMRDQWAPPVFRMQHKPNGEYLRGEDLDFCLRAKDLGYSVVVHPSIPCGHAKPVNLDDAARMAAAAVEQIKSAMPGGQTRAVASAAKG